MSNNCVICDIKTENFNGVEWCCLTHTESEWTYWCENAKQCIQCESFCYKINNNHMQLHVNYCCACDSTEKSFACQLCKSRV